MFFFTSILAFACFFCFLLINIILKIFVCYIFFNFVKSFLSSRTDLPSIALAASAAITVKANSIQYFYNAILATIFALNRAHMPSTAFFKDSWTLILNVYYRAPLRIVYAYAYYIVPTLLVYFYLSCFAYESNRLLHIGVLQYFYSSLYLHILFAYVFVLCCIYAVFIEYYGMANIVYFIVNVKWSWFFYTKEEVERSRNT